MKRHIMPEMAKYLDTHLNGNTSAQLAIVNRDAREVFMAAMQACVGIREKTGQNDGYYVELIQSTLGDAERESWCMALVQTCLAYAEERTGRVSPVAASEHCLTVWNDTPAIQRVKDIPLPGAIIIWRHGNTSSGHTGCTISSVKDGQFYSVEGNTSHGLSPSGDVQRDGGGCYQNLRSMKGAGDMHIVGFIKPF